MVAGDRKPIWFHLRRMWSGQFPENFCITRPPCLGAAARFRLSQRLLTDARSSSKAIHCIRQVAARPTLLSRRRFLIFTIHHARSDSFTKRKGAIAQRSTSILASFVTRSSRSRATALHFWSRKRILPRANV